MHAPILPPPPFFPQNPWGGTAGGRFCDLPPKVLCLLGSVGPTSFHSDPSLLFHTPLGAKFLAYLFIFSCLLVKAMEFHQLGLVDSLR